MMTGPRRRVVANDHVQEVVKKGSLFAVGGRLGSRPLRPAGGSSGAVLEVDRELGTVW